ncbi:hypothetical protein EV715DRAFT_297872 [Schizophyllum commune]
MYAVDLKHYPAPPGNIIKAIPHKATARMCPGVLDRWLLSHHMDDPPPRPSPLDRKNVRPGQVLCQMTRVVIQCTEAGFNDEYFDTYKLLLTLTPCYNDKAPSVSSRPITFELVEYRDGTEGRPLWTTWETSAHIFIESRLVVAVHLLGVLTKGLTSGTEVCVPLLILQSLTDCVWYFSNPDPWMWRNALRSRANRLILNLT